MLTAHAPGRVLQSQRTATRLALWHLALHERCPAGAYVIFFAIPSVDSLNAPLPQIICAANNTRYATGTCASAKSCNMADDALFFQAHANDIRHASTCFMARHSALTRGNILGWGMFFIICSISLIITLIHAAALSYRPDDRLANFSHAKAGVSCIRLPSCNGHAATQMAVIATSSLQQQQQRPFARRCLK